MCLSLLDKPLEENDPTTVVRKAIELYKDPQVKQLEEIVAEMKKLNENLAELVRLLRIYLEYEGLKL